MHFNVTSWFPENVRVKPHFNTQWGWEEKCPTHEKLPPGFSDLLTALQMRTILINSKSILWQMHMIHALFPAYRGLSKLKIASYPILIFVKTVFCALWIDSHHFFCNMIFLKVFRTIYCFLFLPTYNLLKKYWHLDFVNLEFVKCQFFLTKHSEIDLHENWVKMV